MSTTTVIYLLVFLHSYTFYSHFHFLIGVYLLSGWESQFEKNLLKSLVASSRNSSNGGCYVRIIKSSKSFFWSLIYNIHRSLDAGWHGVCSIFWVYYSLDRASSYIWNADCNEVDQHDNSITAFLLQILLGVAHGICCFLHLSKYFASQKSWLNSKIVVHRGDLLDCVCHNSSFVWIWVLGIDKFSSVCDNSTLLSFLVESWNMIVSVSLVFHVAWRLYVVSVTLKSDSEKKVLVKIST